MRIGVDTGGTFTDLFFLDKDGSYFTQKVSSTPQNPGQAILEGILKSNIDLTTVDFFAHGTTVTTNAVIQKNFSKTALITTKGFKDVLEFRRTNRGSLYDIQWDSPKPLIPRALRFEVKERIDAFGNIVEELDQEQLISICEQFKERGIESVAIVFLNSYVNPEHEQAVKKIILESNPNLFVTASTDIIREWREFERTSTVVCNAYVGPILRKYLTYLKNELMERGLKEELFVMLSNGGLTTATQASEISSQTLKSGPSAGVLSQREITDNINIKNSIGLDIGGTSADVAVITNGQIPISAQQEIEFGLTIALPTVDITSIGSGGGSIAWIDTGNSLRVGPLSAGSDPGPVAYDKGGKQPTLTDANLILGRLGATSLVGGGLVLNPKLSLEAIRSNIADPLGMDVVDAARGIVKISVNHMANAIRLITVEKGLDPRDYVLFPYGGAGPMHAIEVARELGMKQIVVPPVPGITAAMGLLLADLRLDIVQTVLQRSDQLDFEQLMTTVDGLKQKISTGLQKRNVPNEHIRLETMADIRYLGQTHNITVKVDLEHKSSDFITHIRKQIDCQHQQLYGHYEHSDRPIEIVNLRVTGIGLLDKLPIPKRNEDVPRIMSVVETRSTYFEGYGYLSTLVYKKDDISTGKQLCGPCVIESFDSIVIIGPDETAVIDQHDNMLIELNEPKYS